MTEPGENGGGFEEHKSPTGNPLRPYEDRGEGAQGNRKERTSLLSKAGAKEAAKNVHLGWRTMIASCLDDPDSGPVARAFGYIIIITILLSVSLYIIGTAPAYDGVKWFEKAEVVREESDLLTRGPSAHVCRCVFYPGV